MTFSAHTGRTSPCRPLTDHSLVSKAFSPVWAGFLLVLAMVRVILRFFCACASLGWRTAPLVHLLSVWVMRGAQQLVNFNTHTPTLSKTQKGENSWGNVSGSHCWPLTIHCQRNEEKIQTEYLESKLLLTLQRSSRTRPYLSSYTTIPWAALVLIFHLGLYLIPSKLVCLSLCSPVFLQEQKQSSSCSASSLKMDSLEMTMLLSLQIFNQGNKRETIFKSGAAAYL